MSRWLRLIAWSKRVLLLIRQSRPVSWLIRVCKTGFPRLYRALMLSRPIQWVLRKLFLPAKKKKPHPHIEAPAPAEAVPPRVPSQDDTVPTRPDTVPTRPDAAEFFAQIADDAPDTVPTRPDAAQFFAELSENIPEAAPAPSRKDAAAFFAEIETERTWSAPLRASSGTSDILVEAEDAEPGNEALYEIDEEASGEDSAAAEKDGAAAEGVEKDGAAGESDASPDDALAIFQEAHYAPDEDAANQPDSSSHGSANAAAANDSADRKADGKTDNEADSAAGDEADNTADGEADDTEDSATDDEADDEADSATDDEADDTEDSESDDEANDTEDSESDGEANDTEDSTSDDDAEDADDIEDSTPDSEADNSPDSAAGAETNDTPDDTADTKDYAEPDQEPGQEPDKASAVTAETAEEAPAKDGNADLMSSEREEDSLEAAMRIRWEKAEAMASLEQNALHTPEDGDSDEFEDNFDEPNEESESQRLPARILTKVYAPLSGRLTALAALKKKFLPKPDEEDEDTDEEETDSGELSIEYTDEFDEEFEDGFEDGLEEPENGPSQLPVPVRILPKVRSPLPNRWTAFRNRFVRGAALEKTAAGLETDSPQTESKESNTEQTEPITAHVTGVQTDTAPAQAAETTSQAGRETPPSAGAAPQTGHGTPPSAETAPKTEHETPPSAETAPQTGRDTAQTAGAAPQTGHGTPPSAGAAPQAGHETPPSAGAAPQAGRETPPSAGAAPQAGRETPPSAGAAPQAGRDTAQTAAENAAAEDTGTDDDVETAEDLDWKGPSGPTSRIVRRRRVTRLGGLLAAYQRRDPAARSKLEIFLLYPGVQAILWHRAAHWLYVHHRLFLARCISQWSRFWTGIEIHPGAKIGHRLVIDHGMGVIIGETTEIGDDCLLYQGVTLGGTGKDQGKRHPTLGNNVLVGSGAKILGPFTVGDNARIAAGAVVLRAVPPNSTAVGVPAQIVRVDGEPVFFADDVDQTSVANPTLVRIAELAKRVETLEKKLGMDTAPMHSVDEYDDYVI